MKWQQTNGYPKTPAFNRDETRPGGNYPLSSPPDLVSSYLTLSLNLNADFPNSRTTFEVISRHFPIHLLLIRDPKLDAGDAFDRMMPVHPHFSTIDPPIDRPYRARDTTSLPPQLKKALELQFSDPRYQANQEASRSSNPFA